MSLHGQQQGVKSAENDPGGIQSPVEGQRLRSVQCGAASILAIWPPPVPYPSNLAIRLLRPE